MRILLFIPALIALQLTAQNAEPAEVEYFDKDYNRVSVKDSATTVYYIYRDSGNQKAGTKVKFIRDTVKVSSIHYSDLKEDVRDGIATEFYPSGAVEAQMTYLNDRLEGEKTKYYETGELMGTLNYSDGELDGSVKMYATNGQIIRDEMFIEGISRKSKCYSPTGEKIKCTPFTSRAEFPGGDEAFTNWVADHFVYPRKLMEEGISGRVVMRFVVDTSGYITRITAIESSHTLFEEEAIRVLKSSPRWNVAYHEGLPVKSYRQIPIAMALK